MLDFSIHGFLPQDLVVDGGLQFRQLVVLGLVLLAGGRFAFFQSFPERISLLFGGFYLRL